LRETIVALITGVWYILVYGTSALLLLARADPWLALPIALWFCGYLALLRVIVPRMRDRSKEVSEARSALTGRIVDSYTNILTVKLFARASDEDDYVRESLEHHTGRFHRSLRLNTLFGFSLSTLNAMLVTGTGGMAMLLWSQGRVEVGTVAMALPLAWQIVSVSGWVAYQVTTIFENVGVVQEGMMTIARPITLIDQPKAPPLAVTRGEIAFDDVRFGYGRAPRVGADGRVKHFPVIDGLTLTVKPGEKVGLVGRSGAGKSTLVNLLLRFFDVEGGRILIDGQDIAKVRQRDLRRAIAVVPQDPALFHRSIAENIGYARPDATLEEIALAARRARAHDFISVLPKGYDTLVGERGVKLSGGERQRVAIARAFLADAPILVLDEATSSLDVETEVQVQAATEELMAGRTTIVIAHRLSTIRSADRILVFEGGRIVEEGRHGELVARGGAYARLHAVTQGA
jgi:ATP-binding cassette subfamily B multidrug efflux pump